MTKVFLDTAYAIAIATPSDKFHQKANQLALWIEANNISTVTTRAILLEIGNGLSKQRLRHEAVRLLRLIEQDSTIAVIPLSDNLYANALTLFEKRLDQEWGLVDCVSYVVMKEQGITQALTTDKHFQQMGFRALLCELEP
jgi:uncharacterized protein